MGCCCDQHSPLRCSDIRWIAQQVNNIFPATGVNVDEVANIAARDALPSPNEGDIAYITDADGSGNYGVSSYNGSAWTTPVVEGGGSADGNGIFSASNDGGTVSAGFNVSLTDWINFDAGNFGLNIDNAQNRLHVVDSDKSVGRFDLNSTGGDSVNTILELLADKNSAAGDGFGGAIQWIIDDTSNTPSAIGRIGFQRNGALNSGEFIVNTYAAGSQATRLRINSGGNVAIGSGAPNARLDVKTGSQVIFNEWTFDIDQALGAGQDNFVLTYDDASGECRFEAVSPGGTPAGADTQIQYNNSGAFGASSNLVFDDSTDSFGVGITPVAVGDFFKGTPLLTVSGGTISNTSGTNTVTGVGTAFLTDFSPGDIITLSSTEPQVVDTVTNDTSLTIVGVSASGHSGASYGKLAPIGRFDTNTHSVLRLNGSGSTRLQMGASSEANTLSIGVNSIGGYFGAQDTGNDEAYILTESAEGLHLGTDTRTRLYINEVGRVGIGTTSPDSVAILDVDSTTHGFLPPRMTTTQRDAITAVAGLVIYNTTTNKHQGHDGTSWNDFY